MHRDAGFANISETTTSAVSKSVRNERGLQSSLRIKRGKTPRLCTSSRFNYAKGVCSKAIVFSWSKMHSLVKYLTTRSSSPCSSYCKYSPYNTEHRLSTWKHQHVGTLPTCPQRHLDYLHGKANERMMQTDASIPSNCNFHVKTGFGTEKFVKLPGPARLGCERKECAPLEVATRSTVRLYCDKDGVFGTAERLM